MAYFEPNFLNKLVVLDRFGSRESARRWNPPPDRICGNPGGTDALVNVKRIRR
jgi:hypothetical protein